MNLRRKLCYSAYTYYFNLPANTRSIWLGRSFKLTVSQNPLIFKFEEREFNKDITCFKIGRYEALRVPKKIILEHAEELDISSPKNDVIFQLDYSVGLFNTATFTKIEPEQEEKKISQTEGYFNLIRKTRKPRKKFEVHKENYIIAHELGFEENLHISAKVYTDDTIPQKRSLCRSLMNLDIQRYEIETWGKLIKFHYCNSCDRIYKEKTKNDN